MQTIYISIKSLEIQVARAVVLREITCDIAKGEAIAIVGANGSGKSTFLKTLCGFIKPKSGKMSITGLDKTQIGYAPDKPPLYLCDSLQSYLEFIATLKQIPKHKIKQAIDNSLQIFDLTSSRNKIIGTLSKGVQQRINLAQAVITQPKLLILDEPSNGLDPQQSENFSVYLKTLKQQETTIIIASHYYTEIVKICDYMLKTDNGKLQKIMLPTTTAQVNNIYDHIDYTS